MAHNILVCALLAMAPVVELRGALPAGLAMGIPALPLYLLCVVCNLIPVPFIIVFIRGSSAGWHAAAESWGRSQPLSNVTRTKSSKFTGNMRCSACSSSSPSPCRVPAAWTGALIAGLRDLRLRYALPVIGAASPRRDHHAGPQSRRRGNLLIQQKTASRIDDTDAFF